MGGMLAWELAPTPDIFDGFVCNLDEKLVTVSGEFYEKSVLVTTGPFYNSFSIKKPAGWKFRSGSVPSIRKRFWTIVLCFF